MPSGSPLWREIEELYHAALECDPSARATLLARADPDVRRKVASLLEQRTDDFALSNAAPFITAALSRSDRVECPPPALSAGTRLGPYKISAQIGVGGMGEVYRATDTDLAREVAIKVLPEAVSSDAARMARFDREAKTLAALNHPNIAAIYGLEKNAGTTALVMELIEGPTLAERIAEGPIPVDEVLLIAAQIAEALEAAHEQGIIHRDLKPDNIKVRSDGTVKVLDFGLAKALTPRGALSHDSLQSPAMPTRTMTQAGIILGTAGYMSPEQGRGEAVDQRSDIWAFGCVLYEMLTGRGAFGAGTVTEVLARILEGHADLDALPVATPPAIRRLIRRCLERSVKKRVQHIGDARADIADLRAGDTALTGLSLRDETTPTPRSVWAAGAIALALLATAGAWFAASRIASDGQTAVPVRFTVPRLQGEPVGTPARNIALSPDGSRLVYATRSSLRIYYFGTGEDVPLLVAGTGPFFSPDGEWLAFFSEKGLRRIPASGGGVETITPEVVGTERNFGGTWAQDGTIIISSGGRLLRVSPGDRKTHLIAAPDTAAGEVRFAWPEFLPDGRSVLFTIVGKGGSAEARIAVIDLETRQQKTLLQGGHGGRYLPTGHLLYASWGRLQTVGFDLKSQQTHGVPTQMEGVEGIAETLGGFTANFAVSGTGTLAYLPSRAPRLRTMAWLDRDGREEPIAAAPPMEYMYPRISPDGTQVALDVGGANRDIHVWHFGREHLTKITHGPTEDLMPAWSPDSARVFFASDRYGGAFRIFSVASDGSGSERQEFAGPHSYMPFSMPGPDQLLAFATGEGTQDGDVAVVTFGGGGHAETLLGLEGRQRNAQVSPDGPWIAYESEESGGVEVYVRPWPDVGGRRVKISQAGGVQPLWGKMGSRELFYWDLEGTLKVVTLTPDLDVGPTRDVPTGDRYVPGVEGAAWMYQISPLDGRVLLFKPVHENEDLTGIKVVLHWFEELSRLAPPR